RLITEATTAEVGRELVLRDVVQAQRHIDRWYALVPVQQQSSMALCRFKRAEAQCAALRGDLKLALKLVAQSRDAARIALTRGDAKDRAQEADELFASEMVEIACLSALGDKQAVLQAADEALADITRYDGTPPMHYGLVTDTCTAAATCAFGLGQPDKARY